MNIKLILTDLDGTLFSEKTEIPEINIRALRKCVQSGIKVALVSGRNAPFIKRVADRIGAECAIASVNGAKIELTQNGPVIYEGVFDGEKWDEIMHTLLEADVNFEAYSKDTIYIVNPGLTTERHKRSLELYKAMGDAELEYDTQKLYTEANLRLGTNTDSI